MAALVGNFIVYIVRLKPLMYLYYVRYYKPAILVSRCKYKNLFSMSLFSLRTFNKKLQKTLVPFPPESSAEVSFAIADFPDIASTNTKLSFSSGT